MAFMGRHSSWAVRKTYFSFVKPLSSLNVDIESRNNVRLDTSRTNYNVEMNDQDWSRGQRDYLSVVELFVRTIIRFGDVIRHGNERNRILIYGLRPHVMDRLLRKIVSRGFLSFKASRLNPIFDRILDI